jgi:hypothetical protein
MNDRLSTRILPPTPIMPQISEPSRDASHAHQVVYIASPLSTYDEPRYDRMVQRAARAYPDAELLTARDLYRDTLHWQATWPQHLARLTAFLYFSDVDGTIGRGVLMEITDALMRRIPTFYLPDVGDLLPQGRIDMELVHGGRSWTHYARVTVLPQPAPMKARRRTAKAG